MQKLHSLNCLHVKINSWKCQELAPLYDMINVFQNKLGIFPHRLFFGWKRKSLRKKNLQNLVSFIQKLSLKSLYLRKEKRFPPAVRGAISLSLRKENHTAQTRTKWCLLIWSLQCSHIAFTDRYQWRTRIFRGLLSASYISWI